MHFGLLIVLLVSGVNMNLSFTKSIVYQEKRFTVVGYNKLFDLALSGQIK